MRLPRRPTFWSLSLLPLLIQTCSTPSMRPARPASGPYQAFPTSRSSRQVGARPIPPAMQAVRILQRQPASQVSPSWSQRETQGRPANTLPRTQAYSLWEAQHSRSRLPTFTAARWHGPVAMAGLASRRASSLSDFSGRRYARRGASHIGFAGHLKILGKDMLRIPATFLTRRGISWVASGQSLNTGKGAVGASGFACWQPTYRKRERQDSDAGSLHTVKERVRIRMLAAHIL